MANGLNLITPRDGYGIPISSARRPQTIRVTLTGGTTKDKVLVPSGAYDVEIIHSTGGSFTYYEGKANDGAGNYSTYVDSSTGATYGTGKVVSQTYEPCYDDDFFWVLGTASDVLYVTFYSIKEA